MTATDGFRSVLSRISLLSLDSSGSAMSWDLALMVLGDFVALTEARIPVGIGIFDFVGGGNVRRESD